MLVLDKTNYINYRICPRYGWHRFKKKTAFNEEAKEQAYQQGLEVEALAQKLFPSGIDIAGERQQAADKTKAYIEHPDVKILYQATAFSGGGLLAKADITAVNTDGKLDLYEVKMTNDVGFNPDSKDAKNRRDKYLYDIAFQKLAFKKSSHKIDRTFLVHMNGQYRLNSEIIDPNKFFKLIDVSEEVDAILVEVELEAEQARLCYDSAEEPVCECYLKPKKKRCPGFEQFNPDLAADDSVFSLNNIRVQKIMPLYNRGITSIRDIDEEARAEINFSPKQLNQIKAFQTGQQVIDQKAISASLAKIKFPLYFLDYEAVNYPIPKFRGAKPFQQIPFQFSLCVLREGETQPTCHDHLMASASDDDLKKLIVGLKQIIGAEGSIVVWHQGAERSFQNNLSALFGAEKPFFDDLNERIFDLEVIFSGQHYIHPGFKGKTSLKNVVPVLTPELNYSDLNINEGSLASRMWDQALGETEEQRKIIFDDLLKYCGYDTLALVKIYLQLRQLASRKP